MTPGSPDPRVANRSYGLAGLVVLVILALSIATRDAINEDLGRGFLRDWRTWSGVVLFAMFLFQWTLFVTRRTGQGPKGRLHYDLHRFGGIFMLLLFVAHAGAIGYGIMGAVSIAIVLLGVTGLLGPEVLRLKSTAWRQGRVLLHYALATMLGPLLLLHGWTALSHR